MTAAVPGFPEFLASALIEAQAKAPGELNLGPWLTPDTIRVDDLPRLVALGAHEAGRCLAFQVAPDRYSDHGTAEELQCIREQAIALVGWATRALHEQLRQPHGGLA